MPPGHGNFGNELPVVYRWAYDFNDTGADKDYIPQTVPPSEVRSAKVEKTSKKKKAFLKYFRKSLGNHLRWRSTMSMMARLLE